MLCDRNWALIRRMLTSRVPFLAGGNILKPNLLISVENGSLTLLLFESFHRDIEWLPIE